MGTYPFCKLQDFYSEVKMLVFIPFDAFLAPYLYLVFLPSP